MVSMCEDSTKGSSVSRRATLLEDKTNCHWHKTVAIINFDSLSLPGEVPGAKERI